MASGQWSTTVLLLSLMIDVGMQGLRVSPTWPTILQMAPFTETSHIVYDDALYVLLSADLSHSIGIIAVAGATLIEVEPFRK